MTTKQIEALDNWQEFFPEEPELTNEMAAEILDMIEGE
jgi:hypothetical protein